MMTELTSSDREFIFSDEHFARIRRFVTAHTGIVLPDIKKNMVYGRLSKHIRKQFKGNFDDFCDAVENGDSEVQDILVNAITTNLTAFFRERHHFDFLSNTVLPELYKKNHLTKRIRIWSAGCSTGEEAYSLAICLYEFFKDKPDWDVRVLATDLDANVLQAAKSGVYDIERLNQLELKEKKMWFKRGTGDRQNLIKVKTDIQTKVAFKRLNLLHQWPMSGPFDVVFCRNVIIYFDKETQAVLFKRFAEIMRPGGYLFIGHSETLFNVNDQFTPLGKTIYQLPS